MYPRDEDDDWYYGEENDGYPSWDSEMDLGSIDGDFDDADESDHDHDDNGDDDHDDDED